MEQQKLKQDGGSVRWDGPRTTGIAPEFAPQEIESPLFATNLTPHNAEELVKRWNAYPELVAALEAIREWSNSRDGSAETDEAALTEINDIAARAILATLQGIPA